MRWSAFAWWQLRWLRATHQAAALSKGDPLFSKVCTMPLPIAIILFIIIAGALILLITQWNPDAMWERRERMYRKQGLATQRPDDWERTAMRQKIGAICFVLLIALWFAWMIMRA
jgi:hypothetical protein